MSLFSQLLQHFPSLEFGALVKKHNAERGAKGFSCRTQLVARLFCQLAHADSRGKSATGLPVVWANWFTSESRRLRTNPRWLMSIGSGPRRCMRTFFIRPSGGSGREKDWACANRDSVSSTNCCRWIRLDEPACLNTISRNRCGCDAQYSLARRSVSSVKYKAISGSGKSVYPMRFENTHRSLPSSQRSSALRSSQTSSFQN
jgi:hypothetical protein